MKLNVKKSKSLVIETTFEIKHINIHNIFEYNNMWLENVHAFNILRIILDCDITLSSLFAKVKKTMSSKIYNVIKIINYIDTSCALTIYKQTILLLLKYAHFLLISGNVMDRNDLQTSQNDACNGHLF